MIAALDPSFGSLPALAALAAGLAVLVGATVLSRRANAPYSAALAYLALGCSAAAVMHYTDVAWLDPLEHPDVVEHVTAAAIVIAIFTTGIKIDRELTWPAWSSVTRLLLLAMPLVIAGAAVLGSALLGLALGGAVMLAAALSPTDPVLAGEIGVGPPGEGGEREERFAVTGEAGVNDALALVFVTLGVALLDPGAGGLARWLALDVGYSLAAAVVVGAVIGRAMAHVAMRSRDRSLLPEHLDPFIGIGAAFLLYGAAQSVAANGFLAVFVGALAFRRLERRHQLNRGIFDGLEHTERLAELAVIVLLGTTISLAGLGSIGWGGWLAVVLLVVVLRPASVALSFAGSGRPTAERVFLGWFGVRGLASLYYSAAIISSGVLSDGDGALVWWVSVAAVMLSIVVHGVTGGRAIELVERRARSRSDRSGGQPDLERTASRARA